MKVWNRGETPKTQERNVALTTAVTSGVASAYVQPWDTKNLPAGVGQRETLTAAVISAVASDAADITDFPARVVELGTGRVLERDPLTYAFNVAPRSGMSAADFRAHIVFQLEYTGECYLVQVGDTLTPLLAASVDVLPAKPGQHNRDGSPALIAGYIVRNSAGRELGRYDAEGNPAGGAAEGRLIRIAHPYPGNPYRADAPVGRARLAIDTLSYARQASAFALRNSGQPAGLVQIEDPSVDEQSITEFDRRLNSRLSDVTQRGRMLVVSSNVKVTEIGEYDPSTGITALSELARRDILSVWAMPESRLGLGGGRTYENQRVETANYLRNTVAHRLGLIASAINQIARARGVMLEFEMNAPELGEQDGEMAARARDLYASGIITLDEARELVGYGPTANGGNFVAPAAPVGLGADARGVPPFPVAPSGAETRALSDRWVDGYDRIVSRTEADLADAAQAFHLRVYREMSKKLRRMSRAFDRAEPMPKVTATQLFDVAAADVYLAAEFAPLVEAAVIEAGNWAYGQFGVELDSVPQWQKLAARRMARLVSGTDALGNEIGLGWSRQLAIDVGDALQAGYAQGEGVDLLAARIADTLGVDRKNFKTVGDRALTIARTEANGLANETTIEAMRTSGVVSKKRWYSIGDSRTRPHHSAANGQTVGIEAKFRVGSVEMDHPHDPKAPAGEVVNCRCRMIPVVSEEDGF